MENPGSIGERWEVGTLVHDNGVGALAVFRHSSCMMMQYCLRVLGGNPRARRPDPSAGLGLKLDQNREAYLDSSKVHKALSRGIVSGG